MVLAELRGGNFSIRRYTLLTLLATGWGLCDPTVGIILIINLLFASETPPFVTLPKTIFLVAISKIKHSISFASCLSKSSKISKSKICAYFTGFGEFSTRFCHCSVISTSRLICRCIYRPYRSINSMVNPNQPRYVSNVIINNKLILVR